jgi:HSP20 family protein
MAFLPFFGRNIHVPFWELEKMRNHMENVYTALAGGINHLRRNYTGVFPLVNVLEDDQSLFVVAELPGFDAGTLDVSVKGDTLTLKGAKAAAQPEEGVNHHRREREAGSFSRSLTLPIKIKADEVSAAYKNGVLTVTLPKAAEARAHQISVQAQ